jgi:hypothetical protein
VLCTGIRVPPLDHTPETPSDSREREKEKSALIRGESDSSDIQSEEKKGICSQKTGDSTCCPKASKDLYLYY